VPRRIVTAREQYEQYEASVQDYRDERHRQELELEKATGGYDADKADYFARGGKPLINYKSWLRSQKGPEEGQASHDVYTPDPEKLGHDDPAWATASRIANGRHPDLDWQRQVCGCVHTTGGRCLPGYRTSAQFNGFDDPRGWAYHKAFEPSPIARQGASAYAGMTGMSDPHDGRTDYLNAHRTPESVRAVAQYYANLPMHDPGATKNFDAYRDEINRQHDFLTNHMGVRTEVTDHDPYSDVHDMLNDLNNNKRIQVLGTHVTGGHPYLDDATNDKFRAVHDVFGHAATGRSFDRHGEQAAFLAHSQMFSPQARPALATETKGQNSSLIHGGAFPVQKTALLHPQFYSGNGPMHLSHWFVGTAGDEIYDRIQKSPGGITWNPDGPSPEHGYMVSRPHGEKRIPREQLSPHEINQYLGDHPEIGGPASYGGWHAPPHWVHDVSENIPDDQTAKEKALEGKQDSVFDLDAPESAAYLDTSAWVNSGPGSALGWTQAKRRR
jgi:hypothetical protein